MTKWHQREITMSEQVEISTWADKKDKFTDRISAAHPLNCPRDMERHARYALAMEMIHARHSKYALVDLVNWLLTKWPELIGD